MAAVLLGWELGSGIGYARRLALIADRLAALGHSPVLALRDPAAAWQAAGQGRHPIVPAPYVIGRLDPQGGPFMPAGYGDLMVCNGFGEPDHLAPLLAAWSGLLDLVRPELVVAEYSPVLAFAAWRRVPTLLLGTPYLMPPAEGSRFPELEGARPYSRQERLLQSMTEVQKARNGPIPERATQPFAEALRIVYSVPELDPWTRLRREPLHGLFGPLSPMGDPPLQPHLFAYLAPDAPGFADWTAGLAEAGLPGEAFIPRCPAGERRLLEAAGITVRAEPPPLEETVGRASLVLHHGGIDTAQTALAMGRPQLLLPRYLDQHLTARALAELRVGKSLGKGAGRDVLAARLQVMATDAPLAERARARARLMRRRGLGDALDAASRAAQTLLARQ